MKYVHYNVLVYYYQETFYKKNRNAQYYSIVILYNTYLYHMIIIKTLMLGF